MESLARAMVTNTAAFIDKKAREVEK